ncbi:GtrA family protein [Oricola sp.]|uniref:GtrA family protein n=1 Tax=Oricola sp. TaxID=1979950 RepID=UPI003BA8EC68
MAGTSNGRSVSAVQTRRVRDWLQRLEPLALCVGAALFVTLMGLRAADGTGVPNSDDLVRLVQVRDLLAGQGWFDLTQYRLGLEAGTPMHWSRLVDAPIAGIVAVAGLLTGSQAAGEALARIVWPAVTVVIAMAALMTGVARTAGHVARLPVAVIGGVALWTIGVFAPGSFDHHNIQVTLSLWLLVLLMPGAAPVRAHAFAGFVGVIMLAIGMEVLPYVAVAGAVVSAGFVAGTVAPQQLRAFGAAVAATTALVFVATIGPGHYSADSCDAFSSFHLLAGVGGGLGLVAVSAAMPTILARGAGVLLLALSLLIAVEILFPHCLENPLASLDPKLRVFWLEGVIETRSLADLWAADPFALFGLYGLGATALVASVLTAVAASGEARARAIVFVAFLAMGLAVTAWQQRGFTFSTAFAVLPLGLWIADLRRRRVNPLRLAGAWLVSVNLVWWMAGAQLAAHLSGAPTVQQQAAAASARDYCYTADVYTPLAVEPPGVILGATDLGAPILLYTPHRAVAGPYHRNVDGNLLLIEAMLAPPGEAHEMLLEHGVTHIADCLRSADSADFIKASPTGLQAALRSDGIPRWLTPVAATVGEPMPVYRVGR